MLILENVSKYYPTRFGRNYVLRDVNITLPRQRNIGILGANGAGKSTLLRLLGGMDTPSLYSLANFVRAVPDGAVLTVESNVRNVLPVNMMGIAMGLHVRCGTEDCLWNQSRSAKASTVSQIEQLVRIAKECSRPIATPQQAREICQIGVFYDSVEETLEKNGFAPNRNGGQQGAGWTCRPPRGLPAGRASPPPSPRSRAPGKPSLAHWANLRARSLPSPSTSTSARAAASARRRASSTRSR